MTNLIRFKRLNVNAKIPTKAHPDDAGYDLTCYKMNSEYPETYIEYDTQIAVAIPAGYVGLLFPRSSVSSVTDLILNNCVGVVESNYRGPLKLRFRRLNGNRIYREGDRVGQLVIVPLCTMAAIEVDELDDTDRGTGGFGSTNT